jgi:2,3-bisphosphoglycerate-independent phosphoglycerate mutase
MTNRKRPVVLIVRDGWGHNPHPEFNDSNAVYLATTPCDEKLLATYPHTQIKTSGEDVGLPDGVMGNSEVGHQNIGAGRIVNQQLMRITHSIREGTFFENPTLKKAIEHVEGSGGKLHLLGLLSDGGVHAHVDHAVAILEYFKKQGVSSDKVIVHAITDGRDTAPKSGLGFVRDFEAKAKEIGVGRIGSVIGRFYAMDRDFRWERVQSAYQVLTQGGPAFATAEEAIESYYANPKTSSESGDEFIPACSIGREGDIQSNVIQSGDAVVFFNYRGDRPREITKAFVLDDEAWASVPKGGFDRGSKLENLFFATMAKYEESLDTEVVFPPEARMKNTLGEVLFENGLSQLRCAESEKHPHVTYFFNDYKKGCFEREMQLDIPSPKHVPTYNQLPMMSATGVTDAVVNAIQSELFDFILVNYANGDMVGHTGDLQAAIEAVETVDAGVGRVVAAALAKGGAVVVTADHGNCEQMFDPESNGPHTKHTTYDVDLIVVDDELKSSALHEGGPSGGYRANRIETARNRPTGRNDRAMPDQVIWAEGSSVERGVRMLELMVDSETTSSRGAIARGFASRTGR